MGSAVLVRGCVAVVRRGVCLRETSTSLGAPVEPRLVGRLSPKSFRGKNMPELTALHSYVGSGTPLVWFTECKYQGPPESEFDMAP